jgi:hypothetical protein
MKTTKALPRITEIMQVEPFRITTRWTTGELRVIDFSLIFKKWEEEDNQIMNPIRRWENFQQVQLEPSGPYETGTLAWPSVTRKGYKGKDYPVALDPDVLYQVSVPIDESVIVIDTAREFTQKEYARRKAVTESVVRNWVKRGKVKTHYIAHLDMTLVVE